MVLYTDIFNCSELLKRPAWTEIMVISKPGMFLSKQWSVFLSSILPAPDSLYMDTVLVISLTPAGSVPPSAPVEGRSPWLNLLRHIQIARKSRISISIAKGQRHKMIAQTHQDQQHRWAQTVRFLQKSFCFLKEVKRKEKNSIFIFF